MAQANNGRACGAALCALGFAATLGVNAALAATGGGPYLGGPTSPSVPVIFTVPSSGGPKAPVVTVTVPSTTVDGLRPDGTATTLAPIRPATGTPTTYTTILKGEPGSSTLRRSVAPIEPANELPKPTQCLAQGEYEKTSDRANAVWERMLAAAEARQRTAPRRMVVGDRGASRSSDMGLESPVRGPARDVFATPSHVIAVPDLDAVPHGARGYFSGQ